eukprot:4209236-Amphidinium_carterae.1
MVHHAKIEYQREIVYFPLPQWMRFDAVWYIELEAESFDPSDPGDEVADKLEYILATLHLNLLEKVLADQAEVPTAIQIDATQLLRRLMPPEILAYVGHLLRFPTTYAPPATIAQYMSDIRQSQQYPTICVTRPQLPYVQTPRGSATQVAAHEVHAL